MFPCPTPRLAVHPRGVCPGGAAERESTVLDQGHSESGPTSPSTKEHGRARRPSNQSERLGAPGRLWPLGGPPVPGGQEGRGNHYGFEEGAPPKPAHPTISLKAELRATLKKRATRGQRPSCTCHGRRRRAQLRRQRRRELAWRSRRPRGRDRGRGKARVGAAGRARRFVLGFAVASAAQGRGDGAAPLPSLGGGSGGDAAGAPGAGSGAWGRRAASPWPRSGCRTGRLGCARSPSCSVRVAGGCGTRADCRSWSS